MGLVLCKHLPMKSHSRPVFTPWGIEAELNLDKGHEGVSGSEKIVPALLLQVQVEILKVENDRLYQTGAAFIVQYSEVVFLVSRGTVHACSVIVHACSVIVYSHTALFGLSK